MAFALDVLSVVPGPQTFLMTSFVIAKNTARSDDMALISQLNASDEAIGTYENADDAKCCKPACGFEIKVEDLLALIINTDDWRVNQKPYGKSFDLFELEEAQERARDEGARVILRILNF